MSRTLHAARPLHRPHAIQRIVSPQMSSYSIIIGMFPPPVPHREVRLCTIPSSRIVTRLSAGWLSSNTAPRIRRAFGLDLLPVFPTSPIESKLPFRLSYHSSLSLPPPNLQGATRYLWARHSFIMAVYAVSHPRSLLFLQACQCLLQRL